MKLHGVQIALRCASLLFAWFCVLIVVCFASLMSWKYVACLLISVAIAILYSIRPNVLCKNSLRIRLAFMLYLIVIAGFIIVSIFAISQLGTGPILLGGTEKFSSGRNWGIGIAIVMTLCAIAGPIELLLYKKISHNIS